MRELLLHTCTLLAYAGVISIFYCRLQRVKHKPHNSTIAQFPYVSIIVPARNEGKHIATLLNSLVNIHYPHKEIILVDDDSYDCTPAIARKYPIAIITAGPKPDGWAGKTWACHLGAQQARGEYILFTDADTIHHPESIHKAITFMMEHDVGMLTTPTFHQNRIWWEKLIGPFYCLMSLAAPRGGKITNECPYAFGQYLLIKRKLYFTSGGHRAVKDAVSDDACLAQSVLRAGGKVTMYNESVLCTVQMYNSLREFTSGWYRIMRLGMHELSTKNIVRVATPLLTFNIPANTMHPGIIAAMPLFLLICFFAVEQNKHGRFSLWGISALPFSIMLFLVIAIKAFIGHLFNQPIRWRGRYYKLRR